MLPLQSLHPVALVGSDSPTSRSFRVDLPGLRGVAGQHHVERDAWTLELALPPGGQLEPFSFPNPPFVVADVPARKAGLKGQA
ncbi:MAG: hypothetical protein L6Q75_07800 [Burkholderiaceae bacterium]|nr:hypothetical protein [Burkholderiaceae bacterium]